MSTESARHLLVVDDDDRIRDLLKRYLVGEGYLVSTAANAAKARKLSEGLDFDLAIVDVMMPGEDGLSLLEGLKARFAGLPVILLTAKGAVGERIDGLKRGADDYVPKPFEPEELSLRIDAILRRAAKTDEASFAGYTFDLAREELRKDGQPIPLPRSEALLLKALCRAGGDVVSRETLAELADLGVERSVDVAVTRLRRKIEPDPAQPVFLQTVRGLGYRLMVE